MAGRYAGAHDYAREYLSGGAHTQAAGHGATAVLSPSLRDRIVNRKFALTYSGLYDGELTHRMILNHLFVFAGRSGKIITEFAIGEEIHADPAIPGRDRHFHVYAAFNERHDIRNRRTAGVFDIQGAPGIQGIPADVKHPEIVGVGDTPDDRLTWIGYVLRTIAHFTIC